KLGPHLTQQQFLAGCSAGVGELERQCAGALNWRAKDTSRNFNALMGDAIRRVSKRGSLKREEGGTACNANQSAETKLGTVAEDRKESATGKCGNPDCPVGCPDDHALTPAYVAMVEAQEDPEWADAVKRYRNGNRYDRLKWFRTLKTRLKKVTG